MSIRQPQVRRARRAAICVPRYRRPRVLTDLRACYRFAEAKGWRIVAMFFDGSPAAGAALPRPLTLRLKAGEFDVVVTPTKAGTAQVITRRRQRR